MDFIPIQEGIFELLQEGVSGFILMDTKISDFVKTIRTVASGVEVLPPSLTDLLLTQIGSKTFSWFKRLNPFSIPMDDCFPVKFSRTLM
jgi:DNA-binding NarL/FixJ family response regulator